MAQTSETIQTGKINIMNPANSILFLGTCAANFSPLLQNRFKNCFDKNARRSSCVLINGRYLIDCGIHCMESIAIAGVNTDAITDLFLTHTHADHFIAQHAEMLAEKKARPLNVWCRRDCTLPPIPNTKIIYMDFGKEYAVGEGDSVFGVDANHDETSFPQHYVFDLHGKKLMYACDGGWVLTRSYNRLKKAELDMLVLDATCGDYEGDYRIAEHNSIPMIRLMLPSFKKTGIINDDTKIYLSHIAPSLHKPHDEIQADVAKDGLIVAHDGLTVQL